jgi:hypothetical protein
MKSASQFLVAVGLFSFLATSVGCGAQGWILAAERNVLFQGVDTVTTPGQAATLAASLRGEDYLKSLRDYTVIYDRPGGQRIGAAKTNDDGVASVTHAFESQGIHRVAVSLDPAELNTPDVPTCEIVVGVFDSDERFVVVDLDHTVVDAGIDQVLLGDPHPLPDAVDVLQGMSKDYRILFLTHRFEHLGARSKAFLRRWEFPEAPLLLSTVSEFLSGSETFKFGAIGKLRETFPNISLGIGDKISDGAAYLRNGMDCYVIIQPQKLTRFEREAVADELSTLEERANIVSGWAEIRESLTTGKRFPPSAMQRRLREWGGGGHE